MVGTNNSLFRLTVKRSEADSPLALTQQLPIAQSLAELPNCF